jgi:hypothetical protein
MVMAVVLSQDSGLEDLVNDDAMLFGIDGAATMGPFSAQIELAKLDDGMGDATPFGTSFGYLITPKMEAAHRYQNLQNQVHTQVIEAAFNYYLPAGKATVQVAQVDSNSSVDGLALLFGFSLGGSRGN